MEAKDWRTKVSCQVPGLLACDCQDFGGEKPEKWYYCATMWRDRFSKRPILQDGSSDVVRHPKPRADPRRSRQRCVVERSCKEFC